MSDINNYQYTRIPFLVLPYINKDIAVPKELIYDDTTEKIYVRSLDGAEDIEIGKSYLEEIISIEIELIKNSVSEDGNTFEKIVNIYNQLLLWKDTITNSPNNDIVSDLSDIIDKFRGLEESDPTLLNLIKSKVDKVLGKDLSTNDFTNELLLKLNSIEAESNNYTHPEEIACSYKAPVLSVNDRIGDVVISKEELGFGNVEEGAIRYSHPSDKQCTFTGISSVNSKTGVIIADKALIGLSEVKNSDVVDLSVDSIKYCTDKYMTPHTGGMMLSKTINQLYPNLKRNQLHDMILNEFIPQPPKYLGDYNNIVTSELLLAELGLSGIGTLKKPGDITWIKCIVNNKYWYISSSVITTNISYNQLVSKGIAPVHTSYSGMDKSLIGKNISINSIQCKCRSMSRREYIDLFDKFTGGSRSNILLYDKYTKTMLQNVENVIFDGGWKVQTRFTDPNGINPVNDGNISLDGKLESIGFRPLIESEIEL